MDIAIPRGFWVGILFLSRSYLVWLGSFLASWDWNTPQLCPASRTMILNDNVIHSSSRVIEGLILSSSFVLELCYYVGVVIFIYDWFSLMRRCFHLALFGLWLPGLSS
ncbi:hypothetical protein RIF29_38501 [Crotalaria pallida]|uniref:Uncharacterized protein n=1 Tax=Crotalaria pallida TaxID=3830 RepID=A0AAN9HP02_CROPI